MTHRRPCRDRCRPSAVPVRFTLRLLGTEIFHVDTDPEPLLDDRSRDLSGGATTSYPVSMQGRYGDDLPDEEYED